MQSDLPQALLRHLESDTVLTALVGARIYPLQLPQEPTLPAITYQQVSALPNLTHNNTVGWTIYRYQLDIYADTYLALIQAGEALKTAMRQWYWANQRYTAFQDNEQDDIDPDRGQYRRTFDFMIDEEA